MSLEAGPFGASSPCVQNCFSSAIEQSACAASNVTCLCMDKAFFNQATGCATQSCGVKDGLTATNLTMSVCQVPQESQAEVAPVLAGVFGMLALIMVTVRIWQRTMFKQGFGWDDSLIVAALLCAGPLNCIAFPIGLGNNMWTVPFHNITKVFKFLYVAEVFYMPAEALTQLSFLFFYLRVFQTQKIYGIAYTLVALSIGFGISNTFVMIFQCTPVTFFWNGWTGQYAGTCIKISIYSWYKAAMQIAMDLSIMSIPIRPLMGLSLSKAKKARICLMFCAGFLIVVVSCLRLQSLIKFSQSANPTYDNAPAVFWSIAECDIAIICACMPFLPSLLKALFPSVFGELSKMRAGSATPEASQSTQASQSPQASQSTSVSQDTVGKEKDMAWQMESSA